MHRWGMGDSERITVTFYEPQLERIRSVQQQEDCSQAEAVRRLVGGDESGAPSVHLDERMVELLEIAAFGERERDVRAETGD